MEKLQTDSRAQANGVCNLNARALYALLAPSLPVVNQFEQACEAARRLPSWAAVWLGSLATVGERNIHQIRSVGW